MSRHTVLPALLALASGISFAAAAAPPAAEQASAEADRAHIQWLQKNAAPLRSVSPDDEDFSDLEPLRAAIGDARVVLLGEQSHGDGTTFLAKARFIKFLHQRMGFDVLAFESGLFDCSKAWDYLLAGEDPDKAFRRGVFGIWTGSAQVKPLIDYVGAMARTARPLELAGFDSQFTASGSPDFLIADLETFLAAQGIAVGGIKDWPQARALLEDLIKHRAAEQPPAEQQNLLLNALDDLHARVKALPADDKVRYGAAFWTQMLESVSAQVRNTFARDPKNASRAISNNGRDLQMARNFLWLAQHRHAGHKIIIWAATFHNMRNPESIAKPGTDDFYTGLRTMGHTLWEAIGPQTYNIGFIATEGSAGAWHMPPPHVLEAPAPGSIDALWAGTTQKFAFLDLKHLKPGGEWLRTPLLAAPLGYMALRAEWPKILDGLVYTRVMEPSTPVKPAAQESKAK